MKRETVAAMLRARADAAETDSAAVALYNAADVVEAMPEPTAKREKRLAPFFRGGAIAREVKVCSACGETIPDKRDAFCRKCGRRLLDE